MKKKKIYIWLGIIVLALIVFIVIGKKSGFIGNKGIFEVSTEKVTKRTIVETVSANGKIQPATEVKISPDVSGEIVELYIKEGDEVKEGDLLAKINPDFYESALERMNAAVNTSKANLANAKARLSQMKAQFNNTKLSFERNEKIYKQGAISQSDFENSKAAYESAQAEVEAAEQSVIGGEFTVKSSEASLKEATDNLKKTSIYAPVSGTISKLNVEKGERVVGTSQFAGTEIMRIANLNIMEVNVDVNENDIVRLSLNDTAVIDIDAFLKRKFKGIVTEIATSANTLGVTSDQVTNFVVKIRILPESYQDLLVGKPKNYSPFRPGMSATVDIQTKTAVNVLTVPIQAVTSRSDTTAKYEQENFGEKNKESAATKKEKVEEVVFVYDKEKAKMVKVKTGIQDNSFIEILQGLKENDEVISAPYRIISKNLKDDCKVKKVDRKDLFKDSKKEE